MELEQHLMKEFSKRLEGTINRHCGANDFLLVTEDFVSSKRWASYDTKSDSLETKPTVDNSNSEQSPLNSKAN